MTTTLGKGLEALIPQKKSKKLHLSFSPSRGVFPVKKESVFLIEVERVKPNPNQPRKDFPAEELKNLADSIKEYGVLQPLIVVKLEKESSLGTRVEYQLIAGERRLRAAKIAGLDSVPAVIRSVGEQMNLEISLVENIQREDLNALERADAFKKLIEEFSLTQKQIAERLGKSREAIANTLRLLDLSSDVKKLLRENRLSEGHARALLGVEDKGERAGILKRILEDQLNVRRVEELARKIKKPSRAKQKSEDFSELEEKFEQVFGVKVKIRLASGKYVLELQNLNDLQKILTQRVQH